ncbi:MAG: tRNA (N(6)-L-threonylcarbamoyladenosine(37)-C(2))-methylthiotransferase MtaB [Lachnospiraceae bacterium]|nr:tRNA (N(6)-L-threonylcarbamoyladenosine(37)-C(2))-methylthiotransferase MtaB [Lachnospiraceae bacterium]
MMENSAYQALAGKKVAFLSLGCKVNSYETDRMREQFASAGAHICDFETPGADVVIINTCSVTNIADRKSRQMLHRARRLSPDALIVATGCYAQALGEAVVSSQDADLSIGNGLKNDILNKVCEAISEKACFSDGSFAETEENPDNICLSDHTRAFIKIQDGCDQFCSYCIIPYVRGRVSSRPEKDVLDEIERMAGAGFKEVVLTGIHLSSYGIDRYEYAAQNGFDSKPLLELVKKASDIDGIKRIRLGSLEPRIITEEFAYELAKLDKFCPQFHLSLQSGSDAVLKRMNRHYTTDDYLKSVEILERAFEYPAITTDIIVGFPSESEEEFEQTLAFAEKIGFLKIHVFKYSRRKGTKADEMPGQTDERIKTQRSERLLKTDALNRKNYLSRFINTDTDVLFEQIMEEKGHRFLKGLTDRYAEVIVEPEAEEADAKELINDIRRCHICRLGSDGILYAKLMDL